MQQSKICALTCWNIDGLRNKLFDESFYQKLCRYDIVGLVETWTADEKDCIDFINSGLEEFNYVFVPATGKCLAGRKSGGIILLYKKTLNGAIKIVTKTPNTIWIQLNAGDFGWKNDIFLATVYIPPANSNYYSEQFNTIETDIAHYSSMGDVMLMGDFNARLGNMQDFIIDDSNKYIDLPVDYQTDHQNIRNNLDTKKNTHGKCLIDMCIATQLRIINGRTVGDTFGNYTYHDSRGSSTIDYFICNTNLQNKIWGVNIQNINYLSRHCQVSCFIKCIKPVVNNKRECKLTPCSPPHKLPRPSIANYQLELLSPQSINDISNFMVSDIPNSQQGISDAFDSLTDIMKKAHMRCNPPPILRTKTKKKRKVQRPYFDSQCREARKIVNELGKQFSKCPWNSVLRQKYNYHKRQYKKLLKQQCRNYKENLVNKLHTLNSSDTKELWDTIDKLGKVEIPKTQNSGLDHGELMEHFKTLNKHAATVDSNPDQLDLNSLEDKNNQNNPEISSPTNFKEIKSTLMSLKNNKAPGPDGIVNELLKYGQDTLLHPIAKLFNRILETGIVPIQWKHGHIIPVQKPGQPTANNQRGLTMLSCVGKVFTKLLNNRITEYLEKHNILNDNQAGFRKDRRTTDNLFILRSLIDKYVKHGKKKLFLGFVDFHKAFDTVWHTGLFYKLQQNGIVGNVYNIIKDIYENVTLQVKYDGQLTPPFTSDNGVRQGDNLSPTLFNIYINDLEFDNTKCAPATIREQKITHLLYADDLLIISETAEGLQNSLTQLGEYCSKWHLKINHSKTKAMIVKNGQMAAPQNFHIESQTIELCTKYTYLGISITSNGLFNTAAEDLKAKASKALYKIQRITRKCSFPTEMYNKMFDALIKPILLYNCEIWGLNTNILAENSDYWINMKKADSLPCELLHHKFCKNVLKVPKQTTNLLCKAELGRYPLIFDIIKTSIKYSQRLAQTNNPLLADSHKYYQLTTHQKYNWSKTLENFLDAAKISLPGSLNENQTKNYLTNVKTHLENQYQQYFRKTLSTESGKLITYNKIFQDYQLQRYLQLENDKHKQTISKLRTSTHKLEIEIGRHQNPIIPRESRICKRCTLDKIEDEEHFLLHCTALTHLRENLVNKIAGNPLTYLLSTTEPVVAQTIHAMYRYRLSLPVGHFPDVPCTYVEED